MITSVQFVILWENIRQLLKWDILVGNVNVLIDVNWRLNLSFDDHRSQILRNISLFLLYFLTNTFTSIFFLHGNRLFFDFIQILPINRRIQLQKVSINDFRLLLELALALCLGLSPDKLSHFLKKLASLKYDFRVIFDIIVNILNEHNFVFLTKLNQFLELCLSPWNFFPFFYFFISILHLLILFNLSLLPQLVPFRDSCITFLIFNLIIKSEIFRILDIFFEFVHHFFNVISRILQFLKLLFFRRV